MRVNKILAIAITDYDDMQLNKIQNCYDDVLKILQVLNSNYRFDDTVFIHKKSETTLSALYSKLSDYFINTLDDENVLVIYAGHGTYNPKLKAAYWQPSNSLPNDASTWLNIRELLNFIKASSAHHISIISDSCFSGALLQENRGGGIETYDNRKSRFALTSGGVEKVSDGIKGEGSPFSQMLIQIFKENELRDLPFNEFAMTVTQKFGSTKAQTPMFGALHDVGDEGGTFVFELKQRPINAINQSSIANSLKGRMNNLYIPFSKRAESKIASLIDVNTKKKELVETQKYDQASLFRIKEKELINEIINVSLLEVDEQANAIIPTTISVSVLELDESLRSYEQDLNAIKFFKFHKKDLGLNEVEGKALLASLKEKFIERRVHPIVGFVNKNQDDLIGEYDKGILYLYRYLCKSLGSSKTGTVLRNELKEIIKEIFLYQLDFSTNNSGSRLQNLINLKQLDSKILGWLRVDFIEKKSAHIPQKPMEQGVVPKRVVQRRVVQKRVVARPKRRSK